MISLKEIQNLITQISDNRGLSPQEVENVLLEALGYAYKRDSQMPKDSLIIALKDGDKNIKFCLVKTVVNDDDIEKEIIKFNPNRNILLSEAKKIDPNYKVGDQVFIPLPPRESFSRIAAQTAKQIILQRLKEAEKKSLYDDFKKKENQVINGVVEKIDSNGNVYVNLGKVLGVMFKNESIPGEIYRIGQRMRFYVYAVENTPAGVKVFLSRSHSYFIPAIFFIEVPEISDGIIEIKSVAREPGVRTKIAVASNIAGIDPVGACIGIKGARVISIMNELNNEKIDVIPWDEDPLKFVANSLLPATVLEVRALPKRTMLALVSEDQVPLAIGKNGQNIRLAAKLTGWQIDVRSAAQPEKQVDGGQASPEDEPSES